VFNSISILLKLVKVTCKIRSILVSYSMESKGWKCILKKFRFVKPVE